MRHGNETNSPADTPDSSQDFRDLAKTAPPGIIREVFDFLIVSRHWWLTPIIVALLLATLVFLSRTAIAPFLYPVW